jgi:hypothetical protein
VSKKPLFIAIGVRRPDTMAELPGVQPSVDGVAQWAIAAGYDTLKIDDHGAAVTVEGIRDLLTPKDPVSSKRDPALLLDRPRIVVYFCGHGLHAPQDQYWILSAGPDQSNERISSVGFREALVSYGPKQISIISDACRTSQVVQGSGQSVVDFNRGLAASVQKDNYFSSQDGDASFSMPPGNDDPGYCVFSRVLLRALSDPPERGALDALYLQLGKQIVSSQSLATYLEETVPDAALNIGKLQRPQCDPGFRPTANDYANFPLKGKNPPPSPRLREAVREAHRVDLQNERIQESKSEWRNPYCFAAARFAAILKQNILQNDRQPPFILSGRQRNAKLTVVGGSGAVGGEFIKPPRSIGELGGRRHRLFRQFIGFAQSERSSVLLCQAGAFVSILPMFDRLWCNAIIEPALGANGLSGGVELVTWGPWFNPLEVPSPDYQKLSAAEALKGLSSGVLRSGDIPVIAADMRRLKHADPLYGIVAAYLYHRIGDIDNIRRMCAYYQQHGQDVPFDIAMMAQLKLQRRINGGFVVDVPKISEVPQDKRSPDAPYFVWAAMKKARVGVAGVTPLLRVGWQNLGASPHAVHKRCLDLTDHLTDSPIATFHEPSVFEKLGTILSEF